MNGKEAKILSCLMSTILIIQIYAGIAIFPARADGNLVFINSYWGSQTNLSKAYSGSSNVILIALIRNDLGKDLSSVSGVIFLPVGVQSYNGGQNATSVGFLQRNGTTRYDVQTGEVFQLNFMLNVLNSTLPGNYNCYTNVTYTYFEGINYYIGSELVSTVFVISDFPQFSFEAVRVFWTTYGDFIVDASSGSRNLNLNTALRNLGEEDINRVDAALFLGSSFSPSMVLDSISNVAKGDMFSLSFSGISVPILTLPGDYDVVLQLNCTFIGYGNALKVSSYLMHLTATVSEMPSPDLQIVRVSWQNFDNIYPGARRVSLSVELQNLGDYTISNTLAVVYLPSGFYDSYGSSVINVTSSANFGYADFATLSVEPIYVSSDVAPGIYYAEVTVYCLGSKDNSELMLSQNFTIPIVVSGISFYLDVATVEWIFNGQPAVAIPGTNNIVLSITLVNRGEDTLSGLVASVQAPLGFKLQASNYPSGPISPASSFTVTFNFNISEWFEPGQYVSDLNLTFNANTGSGNSVVSTAVFVPFVVEDAAKFDSSLILVKAYWGASGNLALAYPGSKRVPLALEFLNTGTYATQGAYVALTAGSDFVIIVDQTNLGSTVASGSFSSATFYLDVKPSTESGTYNFSVVQYYFIELYGATLYRSHSLVFQLDVYAPPVQAPYLRILSSSWENDYPAYPGTQNAVFNIAIANQAPYSISGISASLALSDGFSEGSINGLEAYLAGPISSWQTSTLSFGITMDQNVTLGNHNGVLSIEYTLLSGGNSLRVSENKNIVVSVKGLGGLEPIYSNWLGSSPGPGNTGVVLLVLLRNDEIPQMRGLYANVVLPEGFVSTVTGHNSANVTPAILASTMQIQDIVNMLSGQGLPVGQTSVAQTQAAKGDVLAFQIQMNVGNQTNLGYYDLSMDLNFIDQWSCRQNTSVEASFWLPGSTLTVDIVESKSKLLIGSKTSVIELFMRNNGTAPMNNIYVAIAGAPQGISVSSSIKYLPIIEPLQEVNMSWLVSVNPMSPYVGSLPILVAVTFIDMLGYRHALNQTAIVFVEGIVEISLMDTSISPETPYSDGSLTISTTILNLGTYKAKNVEAYLNSSALQSNGSYSFVGDVDVGAQVPISISATLRNVTGNKTVYLTIEYRDIFNEPVTLTFPMNITVSESPPQSPVRSATLLEDYYKIAFFIALILFMLGSGYILYRMYQKTKRKSQGMNT